MSMTSNRRKIVYMIEEILYIKYIKIYQNCFFNEYQKLKEQR